MRRLPAEGKPPRLARNVIFRAEAENDLTELALYIASHSGAVVANRYLDRIYAACAGLAQFPRRGRPRDDILPGLRTIGFERRRQSSSAFSKRGWRLSASPMAGGISSASCERANRGAGVCSGRVRWRAAQALCWSLEGIALKRPRERPGRRSLPLGLGA